MPVNEAELDLATNDLGPLAWVLDELRKSLESASSALRRFVRDAALARGQDMTSVDDGQLRIARQQLHQAVGALEMVGMRAPAHLLRCMEAAVQKFVERPQLCTELSASKVERAGVALTEYLEALLLAKPVSAVALFPQYRDVQELYGADRIHPADLWQFDWRWIEPHTPSAQPLGYGPAVRSRVDLAVLKIVKSADSAAARELSSLGLQLAADQTARQPRIFWKIAAGYFEAVAARLLPGDNYVKRAASRVLLQYAALAKGDLGVSDRLAQDLLFFCAQAVPGVDAQDVQALNAVREAYGLARFNPVDYSIRQFGRFDPVLLAQARKRISAAKDTWSALSGGDINKLKGVVGQFQLIGDSLTKLHPPSATLAQALCAAAELVVRTGQAPHAELAMEVATAVLYLEAAFQELEPSSSQFAVRVGRLAQRLARCCAGEPTEPLESWMEELYRRVSDRQTMGSVVGELRTTMIELEKSLDQFFRDPSEKASLRDAPALLTQMKGVLSVLGLEQAASSVQHMRDTVEEVIATEVVEDRARAAGTFDKLGNNLGALGFLIDMLSYQPALAKKLFTFDEGLGELIPLMGRAAPSSDREADLAAEVVSDAHVARPDEPDVPALQDPDTPSHMRGAVPTASGAAGADAARSIPSADAEVTSPPALHVPVSQAVESLGSEVAAPAEIEFEEDDLQQIFLEEAAEVVANGLSALEALASEPAGLAELTTLRRSFHTLKGSSRMVGLNEFGEAAWALEQVLNTWLADQRPATDDLRTLAGQALRAFGVWVADIAAGASANWQAAPFRKAADALRLEQRLETLVTPAPVAAPIDSVPIGLPEEEDARPDARTEVGNDRDATSPPVLDEVAAPAAIELDLPADALETIHVNPPPAADEPIEQLASEFGADMATGGAAPDADAITEVESIDFESLAALSVGGARTTDSDMPAAEADAEPLVAFDLEQASGAVSPDVVGDVAPPEPEGIAEVGDEDPPAQSIFEQPAEAAVAPVEAPTNAPSWEDAEAVPELPARDDQVKVIGSVRIGIPLYNVYLNEADEWSRRLTTEISEWALELEKPVPESTIGLAHALAGSSATVGFHALSEVCRAFESALEQTRRLDNGTSQHAEVFADVAEEVRRLLHQFAAGFLKEPAANVMDALKLLHEQGQADAARQQDAALGPAGGIAESSSAAVDSMSGEVPTDAGITSDVPNDRQVFLPSTQSASGLSAPLASDSNDLDVADVIDPDLFPIFEEEGVELMPQLGGALRRWSARADDFEAREIVMRALHTLKGSARLAGALRLGELAHRMESAIEELSILDVNPTDIEALLHRFDAMQACFDDLRRSGGVSSEAEAVAATPPEPVVDHETPSIDASGIPQNVASDTGEVVPAAAAAALQASQPLAKPVALAVSQVRQAGNQAVRVRSHLLDRLLNQAGEVMITRTRLESELKQLRGSLSDLTTNLDRLRAQLRDIELQAETQMQSRLAQAKDSAAGFDPLEFDRFTRVQELTRMMAESVNDVATVQRGIQRTIEATEDDLVAQARQTRELQRDLLRTRMVEFEGISDRLYRVVRLAAKEAGKQVSLEILGGSIEIDRSVLERMTPAFEHLLRNCVAHGIEPPAARVAAGKAATGNIVIALRQDGNDVAVEFRDDGAGLDLARIRTKALEQGLIAADQVLSESEAANLIFMSGFSTASQVTELAGRGIGMDVVRAEVTALGGRIETRSRSGQGTTFNLVLPLTTAVTQVVMVRAGSLSVSTPANLVETVLRVSEPDLRAAYEKGYFTVAGESLPFYWFGVLLQSSKASTETQGKTVPVVIFRSAAQRVAVHVDEVLGNQEVVVKNLGPQLSRLAGLAGMTMLASGAVVLIYNPVALAQVHGAQALQWARGDAPSRARVAEDDAAAGVPRSVVAAQPVQVPLVLVVDDSITVRRVTQRLLQREGYRVALAADGLQALEKLAEERPAVVLSDIEMPRMDGFDLARNIRTDTRLADLPIVMITSRIAQKHREHAIELGVNHYLGKPYSEEELLGLVKRYAAAAASA